MVIIYRKAARLLRDEKVMLFYSIIGMKKRFQPTARSMFYAVGGIVTLEKANKIFHVDGKQSRRKLRLELFEWSRNRWVCYFFLPPLLKPRKTTKIGGYTRVIVIAVSCRHSES